MLIDALWNQVTYPGAGDVDDCWVVATILAMHSYDPDQTIPNIPQFRAAAGDPDDGNRDGGTIDEIVLACRRLWPNIPIRISKGERWADWVRYMIEKPRAASLSVWSANLPSRMRYGFYGAHAVTVFFENGRWWLANPLAPDGSKPVYISQAELYSAVDAYAPGIVFAVTFPNPDERTSAMKFAVAEAYGNITVVGADHYAIRLSDGARIKVAAGDTFVTTTRIILDQPLTGGVEGEDRRNGYGFNLDGEGHFLLAKDVTYASTARWRLGQIKTALAQVLDEANKVDDLIDATITRSV